MARCLDVQFTLIFCYCLVCKWLKLQVLSSELIVAYISRLQSFSWHKKLQLQHISMIFSKRLSFRPVVHCRDKSTQMAIHHRDKTRRHQNNICLAAHHEWLITSRQGSEGEGDGLWARWRREFWNSKREPTPAKIANFSIDPAGFWLRTTMYVERTASKGRRINASFCCSVDPHSIRGQYFDVADVLRTLGSSA